MNADYEILLVVVGTEKVHVFRREARVEKALLHRLGGCGDTALGSVGGVDLDELLEDFAGFSSLC